MMMATAVKPEDSPDFNVKVIPLDTAKGSNQMRAKIILPTPEQK